jgi:hypothetical protein
VSAERWYFAARGDVAFGFSVVDGRVAKVAPIARRWMRGQKLDDVIARLRRNGYHVERLSERERP